MNVSIKTLALVASLLTLAVGAITMRDAGAQAAAPLGLAAQAVDAPDVEPLDPIPTGGEYQPSPIDCVYWSLPAVDEPATIEHRLDSSPDGQSLVLTAQLGRMGTFEVAGAAAGITVTGSDPARAALMQYEMNACLGTGAFEQAEFDALMQAAGQPPYGD